MAVDAASGAVTRKWGGGTAAIVRLLIAADVALTQVAIGEMVGLTQPRASQVLGGLVKADAVKTSANGYRGERARLLELYAQRSRPHLVEPETYWYSARPLMDQAHRIVRAALDANASLAFSADLGPDLLVPWRHPTLAIAYVDSELGLESAGLVPAEGRGDATVLLRWVSDLSLLGVNPPWPRVIHAVPLVDPVQQWFDLLALGGEDRVEAADRLRRAILERSIAIGA